MAFLHQMTQGRFAELQAAFNVFDQDHSGSITIDELGSVMTSLGQHLSLHELQAMMFEADTNKSGAIEFEEFVALMRDDDGGDIVDFDIEDIAYSSSSSSLEHIASSSSSSSASTSASTSSPTSSRSERSRTSTKSSKRSQRPSTASSSKSSHSHSIFSFRHRPSSSELHELELERQRAEDRETRRKWAEVDARVEAEREQAKRREREMQVRDLFGMFDKNGDGRVTARELRKVLNGLGGGITKAEAEGIIRLGDRDGDGSLDINEFARIAFRH